MTPKHRQSLFVERKWLRPLCQSTNERQRACARSTQLITPDIDGSFPSQLRKRGVRGSGSRYREVSDSSPVLSQEAPKALQPWEHSTHLRWPSMIRSLAIWINYEVSIATEVYMYTSASSRLETARPGKQDCVRLLTIL
jgi:hypothetical protein